MTRPDPKVQHQRAPLIEVSPELLARLREPRRLAAGSLLLLGAVAEVIGYVRISDTVQPGEQLPYLISGGIGGLFLGLVAGVMFLSGDLSDARRRQEETHAMLVELAASVAGLQREILERGAPPAAALVPAAGPSRRAAKPGAT